MTTIVIPTRIRYAFNGGVSEFIRMLAAVAPECGDSLIDLDGVTINGRFPYRSRTPVAVLAQRLSHLRTLAFFGSSFPRAPLVFFQTSLNRNALLRDVAFMGRCWRAGRPFAVFIHGWNEQFVDMLSASPKRLKKLAQLLNNAKRVFVLAPGFADTLSMWGVDPQNITVETTMIDDSMLTGFDLQKKIDARDPAQGLKILFMSRIVKGKGIYQAIEAFQIHKTRFPSSTFTVAGDGEELLAVKDKMRREAVPGVRFVGFVEGADKAAQLADADVFLFPSGYGEGLPIALLEAMAFGNTVIARPVGGIGHFLRAPEMGYLEPSLDPERYAILLDKVAENPDSWVSTARFNHEFSQHNTLASRVGRRILNEVTKGLE